MNGNSKRPIWLDDLIRTIGFLTRVPMPAPDAIDRPLMRAAWAFPVAGAIVGGAGALALLMSDHAGLPMIASALIALAVTALVSGALHEDGFGDFFDGIGGGIGGGGDPARRISIMRDSQAGNFAVLALVMATGLKAVALASAPQASDAALLLIVVHMIARSVIAPVAQLLPPADSKGLGHGAGRPGWGSALAGTAIAVAASLGLVPWPGVMAALAVACVAALLVAFWAKRVLGGHTGDVFGTVEQMAEIGILLAYAAAHAKP
ncbi:MAG: adenosylcobinamide-GDP ribazoletransferase [Rhodospirillaceae bacterium]|jgi:adenosylcobinamide-GDP ribazoletransferase|nr:adenosylcobinamide-GDP ribazoletransferase [Rhodospirillaceae bacterium]MBT6136335.1 adenosylcobinamide-GDP ribazoletransferase [Rhodospirillaceae bacterium]